MTPIFLKPALCAAALIGAAAGAGAQTYVIGNYSVDGRVCVGYRCAETETFGLETIKLKADNTRILFDDTSVAGSGFPSNDWQLVANDISNGGASYFGLEDRLTGNMVVRIKAAAPPGSLVVNDRGFLGIGTENPRQNIHVVTGNTPAIVLEQDGSQGWEPAGWRLMANENGFRVLHEEYLQVPVFIAPRTPSYTLHTTEEGYVGLGTDLPEAPLHVFRGDGFARIVVEDRFHTPGARTLLRLENRGRAEIELANTATGQEWAVGGGTSFFLKQGPEGSTSGEKTKILTITAAGDAVLKGTLTTGGTTCGGGCDRVFADDYDLPSIAEHAEAMRALGHLPNMGPMPEGVPFNLTDKFGRLLNEVEHAHLYIAELHERNAALAGELAALKAELAALSARD